MSRYRKPMSRSKSKSYFKNTSNRGPSINVRPRPMRGGIRL